MVLPSAPPRWYRGSVGDEITTATTVTSSEPQADPSAAAAAGVAGVAAGAALEQSAQAQEDAEQAASMAAVADSDAQVAAAQAQAADLRAMSLEDKIDKLVSLQLARTMAESAPPPAAPAPAASPEADQPPRSLEKKVKKDKKSFRGSLCSLHGLFNHVLGSAKIPVLSVALLQASFIRLEEHALPRRGVALLAFRGRGPPPSS